jgi:hypothetical protein
MPLAISGHKERFTCNANSPADINSPGRNPSTRGRGMSDRESERLNEQRAGVCNWRAWGPYLSERQWGTVREDYSASGSAWDYFPHDHARSRAYRWGEDGVAGISDERQLLCFSVAMWNRKDPILKERLFGLTGPEGNHGEDVKEVYYYLDATPTASYLKMLYKYPQAAFPYAQLVEENRRRDKSQPEFELLDTGVFDADRYFDFFVEYAKAGPNDLLITLTAHNRGPEPATLDLVPQIWFRNTWAWEKGAAGKPRLSREGGVVRADHTELGTYRLYVEPVNGASPSLLFTDNESNSPRLWGSPAEAGRFYKDGFHQYVVHGDKSAVNPAAEGTKAAAHCRLTIPAGESQRVRLRLTDALLDHPFEDFDRIARRRQNEADAFYDNFQRHMYDADSRHIQRQAFAGMIWSKQFYHIDVPRWLGGDPGQIPPPGERRGGRNAGWPHLNNADILSMPDKWEYPWYAAWDLAFHMVPFATIDPDFAKEQLILLCREWYMHPNGQLPAYEWAFGDVNPPVHAWAAWKVYQIDRTARGGRGDRAFLERVFQKLLLNFNWWVNRKDVQGRNVFQGGFLGLDNIGVFDRSAALPTGGHINQADGTSWMAMYALNLMRIALELSRENPIYQDLATKFFEHFLYIASAMTNIGGDGFDLWNEEDKFFYDALCTPDGKTVPLKVRSMVGLIPLFAVEVLDAEVLEECPEFAERLRWFLDYRPDLARLVSRWEEPGMKQTHLLSLLRGRRMKQILKRMLDETEFLSEFGIRALSRHHQEQPYVIETHGQRFTVTYQPGESDSGLFGGNSNWRGPIWMPVNYLIIDSLRRFHCYYGDDFKVECPTGSGIFLTLREIADELTRRLTRLFLKDCRGRRPVLGYHPKLQTDPHFRDHILFHEYFHGETGRGVGASHQTGWTGLIASLLLTDSTFAASISATNAAALEEIEAEPVLK